MILYQYNRFQGGNTWCSVRWCRILAGSKEWRGNQIGYDWYWHHQDKWYV